MTIALTPQTVLDFWFAEGMHKNWFFAGPEFDEELTETFGELHGQAAAGLLEEWMQSWQGRLALVILLDQMSRNIYRNDPRSFETDGLALEIAKKALELGDDILLKQTQPDDWRAFLYIPFMHSENLDDQRRCLDLFLTHGPEANVPFARQHLDVIQRFGRFPARNEALGRPSTPEEETFLSIGYGNWGAEK